MSGLPSGVAARRFPNPSRVRHLSAMALRPLIGISACTKLFPPHGIENHAASDTYVRAVDEVVEGVPVLLPASGSACCAATVLARLDGIILTGSRSNVQPSLYGGPPHPAGTSEDRGRDAATLPLVRAAVAQGVPLLGICRGLQEMNVAFGGTLHQRLQDVPGRLDHSTPAQPNFLVRVAKAHTVRFTAGSWLHRLARSREARVNSLHDQGIDRLGAGLVVEAVAPDGTIEAIRVAAAPGFAVGVQWHPEYDFRTDTLSRAIFEAFGDAVQARLRDAAGAAAAD